MALWTAEKLQRVREIIARHHAAIAIAIFGVKALPDDLLKDLRAVGMDIPVGPQLIDDAFTYGQLVALLRDPKLATKSPAEIAKLVEQRKLDLQLSPQERASIEVARKHAGQYVVGLGTRVAGQVMAAVTGAEANLTPERMVEIIRDKTAGNRARRETVDRLRSDLGHAMGNWTRDWQRIAMTESNNAIQEGTAGTIEKQHGADVLVSKMPRPDACPDCRRLYTRGGEPIIFKLSELRANGSNVGRRKADWKPTIEAVHPYCGCVLVRVPEGMVWEDGELRPAKVEKSEALIDVFDGVSLEEAQALARKLGVDLNKIDIGEWRRGVAHEREHKDVSRDATVIARIALAHLKEDPNYYRKLTRMEKSARKLHGRLEFAGMPISIENRKGSRRYWYDPKAKETGSTKMMHPYGYIRLTEGADGDHVDCYVGPDKHATRVYVIHQRKKHKDGSFDGYDEDKVMLAFSSAAAAKAAYLKHYDDPRFFGGMTELSIPEFKRKLIEQRGEKLTKAAWRAPAPLVIDMPLEKSYAPCPRCGAMSKESSSDSAEPCWTCRKQLEAAGAPYVRLEKAGGPFIGPRGGKWADAAHTVPWQEPGAQRTGGIRSVPNEQVREVAAAIMANVRRREADFADDPEKRARAVEKRGQDWLDQVVKHAPASTHTVITTPDGRKLPFTVHLTPRDDIEDPRGVQGQANTHTEVDPSAGTARVVGGTIHIFPRITPGMDGVELERQVRDVLAHEMAHAADPSLHAEKVAHAKSIMQDRAALARHGLGRQLPGNAEARKGETAPEAYRRYVNERAEVTARITQITRDILDKRSAAKIKEAHDDYKADSAFPPPYRPEEVARWSPTWEHVEQHLTPENRKRVLRAVADTVAGITAGSLEPIEKSALVKGQGPFTGPRGGKWADPEHTVPWHPDVDGEALRENAHPAVQHHVELAAHRAAAVGADPKKLGYLGAGQEGVVLEDGERAYKVGRHRHRAQSLRNEAEAAQALADSPVAKYIPKIHSYDRTHDVVAREKIEGRSGGWSDEGKLQEVHAQISSELRKRGFTAPEFKGDSYVIGADGTPKLVDVGFVSPIGARLAERLGEKFSDPEALKRADPMDLAFDVSAAYSQDHAINYATAEKYLKALGEAHPGDLIAKQRLADLDYSRRQLGDDPRVGDKVAIKAKGLYPFDAHVIEAEGDTITVGQSEPDGAPPKHGVKMPKASFRHFVGDLNGRVGVPEGVDPDVDKVARNSAEFLGKGDDGAVFRTGDNVVKASTTVPYQPFNPGHLTPEAAADRLEEQTKTSNAMHADGVPGILPARFVRAGDKGFQIKPYVEIPEKLTREQLDSVAESVKAAHAKGYTFNDEIQVGVHAGKLVHFDTGKVSKSEGGRLKDRIADDEQRLKGLFAAHGERYETEQEKKDPTFLWEELASANPAKMTPEERRKRWGELWLHSVKLKAFVKKNPEAYGPIYDDDEIKSTLARFAASPDLAKAFGAERPGHLYVSRRPKPGGGWEYEYAEPSRQLALDFTPPKQEVEQRKEAADAGVKTDNYFASGSNHAGEIQGFASIGWNVGVAAHEVGAEAVAALRALKGKGTKVFVDSGAFSEVGFGPQGPFVKEPITDAEWTRRLDLYDHLADALGPQLYAVAPDKVAFQDDTAARLEKYADRVRKLHSKGANILVPLQKGKLSLAEFDDKVTQILGFDDYVRAIPMKKDATSTAEFEAFMAAKKPKRVHLLGLGKESNRYDEVMAAAKRASPETEVFLDSVKITSAVERAKPKPGGGWTRPRKLTAATDRAIKKIAAEAYQREEYHENIRDPSEWMPKALREQAATVAQLNAAERKAFLKDPTKFATDLRIADDREETDNRRAVMRHTLHAAIEAAWEKHYAGTPGGGAGEHEGKGSTVERKREAIREAFGGAKLAHLKTRAEALAEHDKTEGQRPVPAHRDPAMYRWEGRADAEAEHREAVAHAVQGHEMTHAEYEKLHGADYGPVGAFLKDPMKGTFVSDASKPIREATDVLKSAADALEQLAAGPSRIGMMSWRGNEDAPPPERRPHLPGANDEMGLTVKGKKKRKKQRDEAKAVARASRMSPEDRFAPTKRMPRKNVKLLAPDALKEAREEARDSLTDKREAIRADLERRQENRPPVDVLRAQRARGDA